MALAPAFRDSTSFLLGRTALSRSLKNDPLLKASAAQDLALLTVKAHVIGEKKGPMPLLNLLKDYVTQPQRVLVLGKPGSGKTTILEALTYHLAQRAYHKQMIVWVIFLILVILLMDLVIFFSPLWALLFLVLPFLGPVFDSLFRRWPLPLFIELHSYKAGSLSFVEKAHQK